MLELKLLTKSFKIILDGKVIFEQKNEPNGGVWNKASIKKNGDMIFGNYLDTLFKEPTRGRIRDAYARAQHTPYVDAVTGISWDSTDMSYLHLDAAIKQAAAVSAPTVLLYDSANVAHTLPIADAQAIRDAIGIDAATKLAHKQSQMTSLAAFTTFLEVETMATSLQQFPGAPVI